MNLDQVAMTLVADCNALDTIYQSDDCLRHVTHDKANAFAEALMKHVKTKEHAENALVVMQRFAFDLLYINRRADIDDNASDAIFDRM